MLQLSQRDLYILTVFGLLQNENNDLTIDDFAFR